MYRRFIAWYFNKMRDFYVKHPVLFTFVIVANVVVAFDRWSKLAEERELKVTADGYDISKYLKYDLDDILGKGWGRSS